MKSNFIIIVVLAFGIASCLNDNISSKPSNKIDTATVLVGKWTVEQDSFFIGSSGVNKMKTDSDYYDFEQNGLLLIKEGTRIDTATYVLRPENNIFISFNSKGKEAAVYTSNENGYPIKGVIINRISGNYLINIFSDSLIRLSIVSSLNPPQIAEGGNFKLKAEITLKR
jgi:hypothetical protein